MTARAEKPPFTLKGVHVLAGVSLFFAVIIGLDGLFVSWALKSWPGEVSATAYEDGLAYNRTLETRARQTALGWSARVEQGAAPGAIRVRYLDRDGAPVTGLTVTAAFARPATSAGERRVPLRAVEPGVYAADAQGPAGTWNLTLVAADAHGRRFEAERRLTWR